MNTKGAHQERFQEYIDRVNDIEDFHEEKNKDLITNLGPP